MRVGHAGRGEQEGGAGRREDEVDLVLLHELGEEAHAGVEVALVVVDLHLHGQLLAAATLMPPALLTSSTHSL